MEISDVLEKLVLGQIGLEAPTSIDRFEISIGDASFPAYAAELWTAGQRKASRIHEISYRACFKPQLPRFFIGSLTQPGDVVYDPFSGRGTTLIEAGLMGRDIIQNDSNPLSNVLSRPRFFLPDPEEVNVRLGAIDLDGGTNDGPDLSMFFHPRTEKEIASLREYLIGKEKDGSMDDVDSWIRMVATNRLTGHSPGFFSVYTLPPNQAVSADRQRLLNRRRGQKPPYRDVKGLVLRKTRRLLTGVTVYQRASLLKAGQRGIFLDKDAAATPEIEDGSVSLTVTSPPFLDVVKYQEDNWLRCWFNGFDVEEVAGRLTLSRSLEGWKRKMADVFRELQRVTADGGWVAFEVGEVKSGRLRLEESVIPLGIAAGLSCAGVLINRQSFTKTSNIWGVGNNSKGTNTNRIVLFQKP